MKFGKPKTWAKSVINIIIPCLVKKSKKINIHMGNSMKNDTQGWKIENRETPLF